MNRYFIAMLVLLALILLALAGLIFNLARENYKLRDEVARLQESMVEDATGGAERVVAPPQPEPQWRFPIADGDYLALTSPHGYRVSPLLEIEMWHDGLDIAGVWRSQVVAVADGVVVEHWPPPDGYWSGHPVLGGMVVLEHNNGLRTVYGHLSYTRVHTGHRVTAGQVIGRIGNTGRSNGPHLHLEVRGSDGATLNPLLYVRIPEEE